jgi:hypothetical protein
VIGNFFLRASTNQMPKKIFNDEDAAITWLVGDEP